MSSTISVTFYAHQSRATVDGQTPIYMRVKLGKDYFDTTTIPKDLTTLLKFSVIEGYEIVELLNTSNSSPQKRKPPHLTIKQKRLRVTGAFLTRCIKPILLFQTMGKSKTGNRHVGEAFSLWCEAFKRCCLCLHTWEKLT